MLGSDGGIILVSTDGKVLGTILADIDEITLGIDFGTDLLYLDGSFDGSNDGNFEGLFLAGSLRFTDSKVTGSDKGT